MTPDPRCPVDAAAHSRAPGDGDRRHRGLDDPARPSRVIRLRSILISLICAGLLALGAEALEAQERVRVDGFLQWIGSNRMQIMTYGGSVAVDLKDADQSAYRALREGNRVVVDGVISRDRTRVMAREVWRIGGSGTEAP
jgi:hypothetical protein